MYDINDSKLLDFVPDYRVQLIQPMTLSEDDFEKFHTSLREVLQTIKYSVDAQKLTEYIVQNERMHLFIVMIVYVRQSRKNYI